MKPIELIARLFKHMSAAICERGHPLRGPKEHWVRLSRTCAEEIHVMIQVSPLSTRRLCADLPRRMNATKQYKSHTNTRVGIEKKNHWRVKMLIIAPKIN